VTASDVGQVSKPAAGFQPASEDLPLYALTRIRLLLRRWSYYKYLESVTLAGSHAKGTALRDSDVDLFLRLSPDTPGPLTSVHASLADRFILYLPKRRNVSVRITFEGLNVDLVPGRRRPDSNVHTLWQARFNTWLKTDIDKQIRCVRSSGLIDEILALKIWRRRHALRFPSFLMELATIHALSRARGDCQPISKNLSCPLEITESFPALLHFLATDFPTTRLLDPANSNNVVSDLLTEVEKLHIARRARLSLWGKWGLPTDFEERPRR
jgi:predicted nucleotidyltransferase